MEQQNKQWIVQLTAKNKDTDEIKTFMGLLDGIGELMNDLILAGYRDFTNVKIVDAPKREEKKVYTSPIFNADMIKAFNASVKEHLI